ncbi:unnamed protein product [Prorocentrum cordatum]|uniref:Uncharacterized protein n=1 Tax=Prorocentrum cordatum TaxID=2364126 RepID=A0ABN9UTZ6_9DINO|nr:unnamed protein product [Polarella glacialis]
MSFKDTFTKEDKEGLLGYDDTAFYYFASSVVLVIAVPWTISAIYNLIFPGEAQIQQEIFRRRARRAAASDIRGAEMREKIDVARKEARKFNAASCGSMCKFGTIAFLWLLLYLFTLQMGHEPEHQAVRPVQDLGRGRGSERVSDQEGVPGAVEDIPSR